MRCAMAFGLSLSILFHLACGGGGSTPAPPRSPAPLPSAELVAPLAAHPGDAWMMASVPVQAGMTYTWSILSGTATGTLASGQGTPAIGFFTGSGTGAFHVKVEVRNADGLVANATRTVTVQRGTWLVKNGGFTSVRMNAASTTLASGRVLVTGGESQGHGANLQDAELYDPATARWYRLPDMVSVRAFHTATLLKDGRVLLAGGFDATQPTKAAELFDPLNGTFSATGPMATARYGHCATLLASGEVLVAGGKGASGTESSSAEIYNPQTGAWSSAGSLATARMFHTMTLLGNGKVLAAGGGSDPFSGTSTCEVFDPSVKSWSSTGPLPVSLNRHAATLLATGKVLLTGGYAKDAPFHLSADAYLYDPGAGTWTLAPYAPGYCAEHSSVLLKDGRVLISSGRGLVVGGAPLASVPVLIDPASGSATALGTAPRPRVDGTLHLLADGRVLCSHGEEGWNCDVFDPIAGTWTAQAGIGDSMGSLESITLLANGQVAVTGGFNSSYGAQRFDPATGLWSPLPVPTAGRYAHASIGLNDGGLLLVGGRAPSSGALLPSAQVWDSVSAHWNDVGSLGTARGGDLSFGLSAEKLLDGRVLVYGGGNALPASASAELFDPLTHLWTPTGSLNVGRRGERWSLLGSGTLLVSGGSTGTTTIPSACERFDPALGAWTTTGTLIRPRWLHGSAVVQGVSARSGNVLIAGGETLSLSGSTVVTVPTASCERWDPLAPTACQPVASMGIARVHPRLIALADGRVMALGGRGLASCEVWDPAVDAWSPTGSMLLPRENPSALLLGDGTVLVTGGGAAITEIYRP